MKKTRILLTLAAAAALAGCASQQGQVLVFGQTQSVGISIGASTASQGGDFTLGYRDSNFAVVPATVRQANGGSTQVNSNSGPGFSDALSVLGQFEVTTNSRTADIGLGKFFATGSAAKALGDGFKLKLAAGAAAPASAASGAGN